MAEPTQENALKAMRLAYEKGDVEAARKMAALAKSLEGKSSSTFMGQVNEGIASTLGGVVDAINPFNDPVWGEVAGGVLQTGSATEGLRQGMEAIGADVSREAPQNVGQAFGRGIGNAAGAILPVAGVARLVGAAGGLVGQVADDAYAALTTKGGAAAELTAGGLAGAAEKSAEEAGAPRWVQQVAAIAAPLGIPAGIAAVRGAGRAAASMPMTGFAVRTARDVARGLAPMTEYGARQVAAARLRDLSGGEERARELATAIDPNDPLGRTGPQQTGDPNLLGLERAAADENPLIRERLDARATQSRTAAQETVAGMGGKVRDAKTFFEGRLKSFKSSMQSRVDQLVKMADEGVSGTGPRASETGNSVAAVDNIKAELASNLERERELWRAVPTDARVETTATANAVETLIKETPWAQRRDIPADLKEAFGENGALGKATTVAELHGLYSEMRRISRSAMSGTNQNKNLARIANDVAEAILNDLGAIGGESPAGRAINEARVFSRALHETFDQGAVGRILQRTIDGDEAVASEAALARTVGRGGAQGLADAAKIEGAAPRATEQITDYLRGRFMDSIFSADGSFTPRNAETFFRQNRELLSRYPRVMAEFRRALSNRNAADAFAARSEARVKLAETNSPVAGFTGGQDQKAVLSIIGADNPELAARSVIAAARKDPSGKALAGVKGAFSDYLIGKAGTEEGLSGEKLQALLRDGQMRVAIRQVFDGGELSRLQRIADDLARMEGRASDVGAFMDSPSNRLVEYVVRIVAAQKGGQLGGGTMGGSLQAANIVQERARALLRGMTNDKARRLLMDAIEDPALFKALMTEDPAIKLTAEQRNKLAPYLTGGAAAAFSPE